MNSDVSEMIARLKDDEAKIQDNLGKLRQSLADMEVNLHRTQGALFVLESLANKSAETVAKDV